MTIKLHYLFTFVHYLTLISCQLNPNITDDLAQSNFTVIRDEILQGSSLPNSSEISSNATNLEARTINFIQGPYRYIGRIADEGRLPMTLSGVLDITLLSAIQSTPQQYWTPNFGPRYLYNAKATLTFARGSPLWPISGLSEMMIGLRDHLRGVDSDHNMQVSVATTTGLRAVVKVEEVGCRVVEFRYRAPRSNTDDKVVLFLYTADEVDRNMAVNALGELTQWAQRASQIELVQPDVFKTADLDDVEVSIRIAQRGQYTADITYGAISQVLQFISRIAEKPESEGGLGGHYYAFQAMLTGENDGLQGQINCWAIPPGPRRPRPDLGGGKSVDNGTYTEVTDSEVAVS